MQVSVSVNIGKRPRVPDGKHMISSGVFIYVKDGDKHRERGPAEINTRTGYQAWFWRGKRHRKGGPAVIYGDGRTEYWENGKKVKPPQ